MQEWGTPRPLRAAFFDADGTLLSFASHEVPLSARRALEMLRASGVRTFLCTGRSPSLLDDVPQELFDACVTMSGAFCYAGDEAFLRRPITHSDLEAIVDQVEQGLYHCLFMEPGISLVSGYDEFVRRAYADAKLETGTIAARDVLGREVYQLNVFVPSEREEEVLAVTKDLKLSRWSPNFADAMHVDAGKGAGVLATLERFGIAPDEAVAFGDGGNDAEMFAAVETSVAMGGAAPSVKELTTYVTDGVDEDGIWNACKRLNLL